VGVTGLGDGGDDSDYCYGSCNEAKGRIKGKDIRYNKRGAF
jgi:hypothetical protein